MDPLLLLKLRQLQQDQCTLILYVLQALRFAEFVLILRYDYLHNVQYIMIYLLSVCKSKCSILYIILLNI